MSLIRKNILWLLVSQLATWVATFATLIIVPNKLGSADFGDFSYATGYVQFFVLAAGLGTSAYLSRAIARDYDLLGPYVWNAVFLKFVLWVALSALALGISYALLGNRGQTFVMVVISCFGMLPFILTEVFFGALTGMQRIARPAMWTVVQVWFQTVFGILVLVLGWGVVAYAVVMVAGTFIPMAASALMVRPLVRDHHVFDWKIWRLLVVGGVPLLALTFFNFTYGMVNVPIMYSLVGSDPVGWYTVALRWVSIPIFITTAVIGAYFPVFSQHGNPITDEFAPLVNRAVNIVLVVTIPAALGIAMVADDMIHLIYGSDYDNSIVLIRILALQHTDHRAEHGAGNGPRRVEPAEPLSDRRRRGRRRKSDPVRVRDQLHRRAVRQRRDRRRGRHGRHRTMGHGRRNHPPIARRHRPPRSRTHRAHHRGVGGDGAGVARCRRLVALRTDRAGRRGVRGGGTAARCHLDRRGARARATVYTIATQSAA